MKIGYLWSLIFGHTWNTGHNLHVRHTWNIEHLSNWEYTRCDKSIETSIFDLTSLKIAPQPALGEKSILYLDGILRDGIGDITEVDITVQFGRMTVYKKTLDFCEDLDEYLPEKCPIENGAKNWTYGFELSNNIPSGTYTIKIDINQKGEYKLFDVTDERQLICLILKLSL
jgi:hypothetical protein